MNLGSRNPGNVITLTALALLALPLACDSSDGDPTPEPPPGTLLSATSVDAGKRESLIELFEQHFLDGQEACGIRVLGQFRDAEDPDRFVWVRGFRDMPARAESLKSFYGGPSWHPALSTRLQSAPHVLRLEPTTHSRLGSPWRGTPND